MRSRWGFETAPGVKILVRKVMNRSSSSGVEEGENLGIAICLISLSLPSCGKRAYFSIVVVCLKKILPGPAVSMLHNDSCGKGRLGRAHWEPLLMLFLTRKNDMFVIIIVSTTRFAIVARVLRFIRASRKPSFAEIGQSFNAIKSIYDLNFQGRFAHAIQPIWLLVHHTCARYAGDRCFETFRFINRREGL